MKTLCFRVVTPSSALKMEPMFLRNVGIFLLFRMTSQSTKCTRVHKQYNTCSVVSSRVYLIPGSVTVAILQKTEAGEWRGDILTAQTTCQRSYDGQIQLLHDQKVEEKYAKIIFTNDKKLRESFI
jgi:hypothetical protein